MAVTAPPNQQPAFHLWGHRDDGREAVFREAYSQLGLGKRLLHVNRTYPHALAASARGKLAGVVVRTLTLQRPSR